MTLAQLIAEFRRRTDDRTAPYIYGDDDAVTLLLSEAEREAAERALLLTDSTTANICEITLDPTTRTYLLDARVIDVDRVTIDGVRHPLTRITDQFIDRQENLPAPAPTGQPCAYALTGFPDQLTLTLDRLPADTFITLRLTVKRAPLISPMVGAPEISARFHFDMLLWAFHLAYDTRDSDATSAQRAADYKQRFAEAFGPPRSADVKRKQLRHRPTIVRPEGAGSSQTLRRAPYRPTVDD